jgi:hypothetical protein
VQRLEISFFAISLYFHCLNIIIGVVEKVALQRWDRPKFLCHVRLPTRCKCALIKGAQVERLQESRVDLPLMSWLNLNSARLIINCRPLISFSIKQLVLMHYCRVLVTLHTCSSCHRIVSSGTKSVHSLSLFGSGSNSLFIIKVRLSRSEWLVTFYTIIHVSNTIFLIIFLVYCCILNYYAGWLHHLIFRILRSVCISEQVYTLVLDVNFGNPRLKRFKTTLTFLD